MAAGMIHILKFDSETIPLDSLETYFKNLKEVLDKDDIVIAFPYGIDFLYNIPIDEVINMRNQLDEIINSRVF